MMKACFMTDRKDDVIGYIFGGGRRERFEAELDMMKGVYSSQDLANHRAEFAQVEVILSSWGMPELTAEQLETYFPKLKLVLYGAASVQYFARPYLQRGVKITTAAASMAEYVAQFTYVQILQANKGYYHAMSMYRAGSYDAGNQFATRRCPGTFGTKIGIIGAGAIGSRVIRLLRQLHCEILVFDLFLPPERTQEMGVTLVSLETLFSQCQTISNHLANNAQTMGILNYDLFKLMKPDAAFINTGRGAQVVEADLARALREEPLRCALLDVTFPEPCPREHIFWRLPNVFMTPHIAGIGAQEVWNFADLLLDELHRYQAGVPLQHEVRLEMLKTLA